MKTQKPVDRKTNHFAVVPFAPAGGLEFKLVSLMALFGLLLLSNTFGGPITIGYSNCVAVPSYSQSLMDQIGQLKWYFTHASVGEEMLTGITALNTSNPSFYQLHEIPSTDQPAAATEPGGIYDYDRGNPGSWWKMLLFQDCVDNGWRYPLINIAMNKYCFIDTSADVDSTVHSVSDLESSYPETLFVYTTLPLTTDKDSENYTRNDYNVRMRDWCQANNRVLFDIADIEAHDTNGIECTYVYSDQVCQYLWEGYNGSGDGGHPDNLLGQELIATGFYALSAALLSRDSDGDGMSDGRELIAGTRPLDASSALKLRSRLDPDSGSVILQWSSSTKRFYVLQRATDDGVFTNLTGQIAGSPPLNTYTDTPPAGVVLYRVSVRQ